MWRAADRRGVRHLHAVFADVATDVALLVTHYGGTNWTWSLAVHGPVEFYDVSLNHLAEKLASSRFAVAISDFGRSQLMAVADDERWNDIHVVHCGIDPEAFPVSSTGRRSDTGRPHVVCVGRLVHIKGQPLLVAAVAELRRRGVDARLTLVGEGPKRAELVQQAQRLGIGDDVTFTGAVGQDQIGEILRSADVFCLPSMAEGVPVVLMEAMALEVPVIATRIMGIPELIEDGVNGLLVAPGRLDLLVEALRRLIDDADLRDRLGKEGRRRVLAEYDVNLSATRLRDVLVAAIK
jgi:glycosyltransferase involved in cell wall biosynthesis